MKVEIGEVLTGSAGSAKEIKWEFEEGDRPDWKATVASWFLYCPEQAAAREHYRLAVFHLRSIEGIREDVMRTVEGATHQVYLFALDPSENPIADDATTWRMLTPVNVNEQIILVNDEDAKKLLRQCAEAVVNGLLPAEPFFSGQIEPWHSTLQDTAAHYRGEHDE